MIVARLEEAEEATKNERKNQDEDVGVNLSRVEVWYGMHVTRRIYVTPCFSSDSFLERGLPVLEFFLLPAHN